MIKKLVLGVVMALAVTSAMAATKPEFIKKTDRGDMVLSEYSGVKFTAIVNCKNRKVWMNGDPYESITVKGDPMNYQMPAFSVWRAYCKSK
ncbi:hypothetical protein phiOC_p159 [Ochrobactrum phage vB_OspM_OC]|nr:hypothetical protein phiOC_p159 [Ochrobactrum phage vB_OspM_OC]